MQKDKNQLQAARKVYETYWNSYNDWHFRTEVCHTEEEWHPVSEGKSLLFI